jgi:hypothetical protein
MRGSSQTPRIRWNRPPNRVGPPREWSQPARRAGSVPRLGISPGDLRQWARTGFVRPVFYGGYLPDGVTDSIEMRAGLAARLLPEGHIVSGRTAAWLYGVDTYAWAEGSDIPPIDVCVLSGSEPSDREGVVGHVRDLSQHDVTTVAGIRATTPLRTAMDLGCILKIREAIAAMDALARLRGVTVAAMTAELPRFRRRRGVRQLRVLVPLVDPGVSRRESRGPGSRSIWPGCPRRRPSTGSRSMGSRPSASTSPIPRDALRSSTTGTTRMSEPRSNATTTAVGANGCAKTAGRSS